jgi:hypothetical protein
VILGRTADAINLIKFFQRQHLRVPRVPRVSLAISFIEGVHIGAIKIAACPKFDMVWLNRSPILVGGGGG